MNGRKKGEIKVQLENHPEKKEVKRKSKTIKTFAKNENSLYQRRMKDFREGHNENKYLQRKKDMLAQRQEFIDKANEKHKQKMQKEDSPQKEHDR